MAIIPEGSFTVVTQWVEILSEVAFLYHTCATYYNMLLSMSTNLTQIQTADFRPIIKLTAVLPKKGLKIQTADYNWASTELMNLCF